MVKQLLMTKFVGVSAEQAAAILAVTAKIAAAKETVKRTRLYRPSAVFLTSEQKVDCGKVGLTKRDIARNENLPLLSAMLRI
jgi:hypothetical protein